MASLKRSAEGEQRPQYTDQQKEDTTALAYQAISNAFGEYLQKLNGKVIIRYMDGYFLGFWDEPDITMTIRFTAEHENNMIYRLMQNTPFKPSLRPREDIIGFTMEVCGYLSIYKPNPIPLQGYLEMLYPYFESRERQYLDDVTNNKYNLQIETDADFIGKNMLYMYRMKFYSIYQRHRDFKAYKQSPRMALMRQEEEGIVDIAGKKDHLQMIKLLTEASFQTMKNTVEEMPEIFEGDGTFTSVYLAGLVAGKGDDLDLARKQMVCKLADKLYKNIETDANSRNRMEEPKKRKVCGLPNSIR